MTASIEQLVGYAHVADAADGTSYLSTGESLAAALILNRADWLDGMGYTLPEAIDRLGADWLAKIPEAARRYRNGKDAACQVMAAGREAASVASFAELATSDEAIDCNARLRTYSYAPGYRDMGLRLDLTPFQSATVLPVDIRLTADDTLAIARHAIYVLQSAWGEPGRRQLPIDHKPGETPPSWLALMPS